MTSTYYFEKIVVLYEIYTQKSEVMNNHVHLLYMETSHLLGNLNNFRTMDLNTCNYRSLFRSSYFLMACVKN